MDLKISSPSQLSKECNAELKTAQKQELGITNIVVTYFNIVDMHMNIACSQWLLVGYDILHCSATNNEKFLSWTGVGKSRYRQFADFSLLFTVPWIRNYPTIELVN